VVVVLVTGWLISLEDTYIDCMKFAACMDVWFITCFYNLLHFLSFYMRLCGCVLLYTAVWLCAFIYGCVVVCFF
jgi:hypothetical protein